MSIEIEQTLLGCILIRNDLFAPVGDKLLGVDFSEGIHAQIFDVCRSLIEAGKLASPLTIKPFLPADWVSGNVNIQQYLARLAADACTANEAVPLAMALRRDADQRALRAACSEVLASDAANDPGDLAAWLVEQADSIALANSTSSAPALDMDKAVMRAVDAAAVAFQGEGRIRGVSYGLRALDEKTLGAMPADLVVIAGRPGMGKSAIALGIARNMALRGERVLFWSGEMGDVALTTRMMSDHLWTPDRRLTYWQIASGKFREERFQDIRDAGLEMAKWPLRIEQQPGLTVAQIGARARQYKRRFGLKALFVDHLGLVKPSGRYAGNKVNETGEVTMGLKALAKELGIPVFLLCQINRGVEQREDKRPTLSDLRNSGDIEQDADTVLILYRPAYYLAKKEPAAWSAEFIIWADEMAKVEHRLDCVIEKQRSGPVGTVRLHCDIGSNAVRDEFSEMDETIPLSDKERADFK
jgi:replicative DNA helicase